MTKSDQELSRHNGVYRFANITVSRKYVTPEQVQYALAEQKEDDIAGRSHRFLGEILLDHNWITEEQLESVLEEIGGWVKKYTA